VSAVIAICGLAAYAEFRRLERRMATIAANTQRELAELHLLNERLWIKVRELENGARRDVDH